MRHYGILVASILTAGCSEIKNRLDGGHDFSGEDVEMLLAAASAPYMGADLLLLARESNEISGCPSISYDIRGNYEIWGGCEDDMGAWAGRAEVVNTDIDGDDPKITAFADELQFKTQGDVYYVDGSFSAYISDTHGLSDVTVSNGSMRYPGMSEFTFGDYIGTGWISGGDGFSSKDIGFLSGESSGFVDRDGDFFSFFYDASVGQCALEPDEGSIEAEGSNTITITFDGAEACDGCIPWETDDGQSGLYCL